MAYRWINLAALSAVVLLLLFTFEKARASHAPVSLEDLTKTSPQVIPELLAQVDFSRPGLEQASSLYRDKKNLEAAYALLEYYKKNQRRFDWINTSLPASKTGKRDPIAEQALDDIFTLQGITYRQKRVSTGGIDWHDLGSKKDKEWGWMLNRHPWFLNFAICWASSSDPKYAKAFNRQLSDWILSNSNPPFWNASNSPTWRALEVGRRLYEFWPPAFYAFQNSTDFSPASRILMLHSIYTQAEYCRNNLSSEGNHLNTELIGLAAAATYWPEFKKSREWLDFSAMEMEKELSRRVYPDGSQMELSNHYQIVVATHCQNLANYLNFNHHPQAEKFNLISKKLWGYTQSVMKPNGDGPLNNDCDLESNNSQIARNKSRSFSMQNRTGISSLETSSSKPLSSYSPWAGHAIMRGTKGGDADWSFFDVGPLGTAHQHYDTLNFTLFTGGRDILVDAGRYIYKPGRWRRYFTGQSSHNVVLINGGGENLDPRQSKKPVDAKWVSRPEFDFATGSTTIRTDSLFNSERTFHSRSVLYVRDKYWLVIDQISAPNAEKIEVPWHFHPDCSVEIRNKNEVATTDKNKGNLLIIPWIPKNGSFKWQTRIIKGQTKPDIQGWYSPSYNIRIPSPVAMYEMHPQRKVHSLRPITLAWLMIPGKGIPPRYKIEDISNPSSPETFSLKISLDKDRSDLFTFTLKKGIFSKASLTLGNGEIIKIKE